jgi:hypothetical protein
MPQAINISVSSLPKMEARGDKKRLSQSTESSYLQSPPPAGRSIEMELQSKVDGKSTEPSVNDTSIDSSEDITKKSPGNTSIDSSEDSTKEKLATLGGAPEAKRATTEEPSDDTSF